MTVKPNKAINKRIILLEEDGEGDVTALPKKVQKRYQKASLVFGMVKNSLNKDKFKSLYHEELFPKVLKITKEQIQKELLACIQKSQKVEFSMANIFTCTELKTPYFKCVFFEELKKKYPHDDIICITRSKSFLRFNKSKHMIDQEKLIYVAKEEKSSIQKGIAWFYQALQFSLVLQILLRLLQSTFFYLLRKFQVSNVILKPQAVYFIAPGVRALIKEGEETVDFYYKELFSEVNTKYDTVYITKDFSKGYSYIHHLQVSEFIKGLFSAVKTLKSMRHANNFCWAACPNLVMNVIELAFLEKLFCRVRPKALIFREKFLAMGRGLSLMTKQQNIPTFGFQKCIESEALADCQNIFLYKDLPEIFPDYVLIYGDITEKIYTYLGYPKEKLIKIGSLRLYQSLLDSRDITKKGKNDIRKDAVAILYLSPNTYEEFKSSYEKIKNKFPTATISIRPHPNYGKVFLCENMSRQVFNRDFPEVKVIEAKKETVSMSLSEVDIVFATAPTTVIIDAILMNKKVILLTDEDYLDVYNLLFWGCHKIKDINDFDNYKKIDNKKRNSLIKELEPRKGLVDIFEKSIG